MKMRACDYFDYEPLPIDAWHKKLANSETAEYTFISHSIAFCKRRNLYFFKHYKDNNVNTWSFNTTEEAAEHARQLNER